MMEKRELIREIIGLQRRVDRARRQYQVEVWMGLPLSIAQLKCLFFISNEGGTGAGKIAAALGVTPTNMTGIIDRLVKQGLVKRLENEQDRRISSLYATKKGEDLAASLREKRQGYLAAVLNRMDFEELTALSRGLAAFIKAETGEEESGETFSETGSQPVYKPGQPQQAPGFNR